MIQELKQLEGFQKKAVKWITGLQDVDYKNQIRLLNILPLPMFLQLNSLLLLSKFMNEDSNCIELPETVQGRGRKNDIFCPTKKRTEKARGEFVFKNCRLANRIDKYVDFSNGTGLKNRIITIMWNFVNNSYSEKNICTWQLFCDCHLCRNKWTIF